MDKLTAAQQAVQAVKKENAGKVTTIEINGAYYDVVYKEDSGKFRDLTGLDTKEVEALASAVLSAHEAQNPKTLAPRDISHIDSTGVHYTDKTDEAHESVKIDAKGFEALDHHLGITSTINGISSIYKSVETLGEKGEINYKVVLEALEPSLSAMVSDKIKDSGDLTKEGFLKILDECANSYLSAKLDISSSASAPKEAIVHNSSGENPIDTNASLQAFKEAATAKHAWDAMNATIAKTHRAAAKAPIPSSSSLGSGVSLVPTTSTRLGSSTHKECAKKTKGYSGSLSSPQPRRPSKTWHTLANQAGFKASPIDSDIKTDEAFFPSPSSPSTSPLTPRKNASPSSESLVTRDLSSKPNATSSKRSTFPTSPRPVPTSRSFPLPDKESESTKLYTPPISPEKTLSSASRALSNGVSIVAHGSPDHLEEKRVDKALSNPVGDDGISDDSKLGGRVPVARRKLKAPAKPKSFVEPKPKLTSPTSTSSPARVATSSVSISYGNILKLKEHLSSKDWYNPNHVPEDTQTAKKNISNYLFKSGPEITKEEKNYLFNLVEQVEKEDIKTEQIKMKRLKQLLKP